MRKRYDYLKGVVVLVSVCLIMSMLCAQVFAVEPRPTGFSQGFNFGVARYSGDDFGTGFGARAFLEYAPFIHEIGIRLSGGYLRFKETVTLGYGALSSEEKVMFEDFYATAGLIYRFSRGKIVPFLTGNLGIYHYNREKAYPASGAIINGVQMSPFDVVKTSTGNDFGFNIGGGVEYFTSNRTSMSLEMVMHSIQGNTDSEIFDVGIMFRFFPQKR